MNDILLEALSVGLAAVAFSAVLYLIPMVSRLKRRLAKAGIDVDEDVGEEGPEALSPELVAVIAAAIAAASGMGMNEFRVIGVNRVEGSGSWNTPVWGHVDRLAPRPNVR